MKTYWQCAVEHDSTYKVIGFAVEGEDPREKIEKFFKQNRGYIRYASTMYPLHQLDWWQLTAKEIFSL